MYTGLHVSTFFKRSSSGLLADRVNRFCVHVGIPVCLHWLNTENLASSRIYLFNQCKHIGIPTCTQHLLTQSARRPDDDRLKKVETCSLVYIKIVVLDVINKCFSISLAHRDVFHQMFVCPSICPFQCLFPHMMWITWRIQHVNVWKRWVRNCVKHTQSLCWVFKNYSQYHNERFDHLLTGPLCTPSLMNCLWCLVIFFVLHASFIICTLL